MRQSQLFSHTVHEPPKDATSANQKLLTMAGFVDQIAAGIYAYLPLGLRVLEKVHSIIREEMNAVGGQEMHMPALLPKSSWMPTGRWDSASEVMYKLKDDSNNEYCLGWTHEEIITAIAKRFIHSYRDLPKAVYQIQDKFRNEARPKSGLIRGREFGMKDLYSFHADQADLDDYYPKVLDAYRRIFTRCGLETKLVEAPGGSFTKMFTDEFQVLSDAGEDTIVYCPSCEWARNKELFKEHPLKVCPNGHDNLQEAKSIEVGNTFKLGTRFSEAFKLTYHDAAGKSQPVVMASYGIGPGRMMGTIIEIHNDAKGMIWPASVAPFDIHLVRLGDDKDVQKEAERLESTMVEDGWEVLHDDRENVTVGEKLNDADLIGIPLRIVVSARMAKQKSVEVRPRSEKQPVIVPVKEVGEYLAEYREKIDANPGIL